MKKSYKDFGLAIEDLRQRDGISYDTIAFGIRRAQSFVYSICNRRVKSLPKDDVIKEFADYFNVDLSYFYEYRLKGLLEFIDKNREFLDHCEKEQHKWLKKEQQKNESSQDSEAV